MKYCQCLDCGAVSKNRELRLEIQLDGDIMESCPCCLSGNIKDVTEQLIDEQSARCTKMAAECPDEVMDWKEFEEDIMGWDYC